MRAGRSAATAVRAIHAASPLAARNVRREIALEIGMENLSCSLAARIRQYSQQQPIPLWTVTQENGILQV
jgi:hypothetical protein